MDVREDLAGRKNFDGETDELVERNQRCLELKKISWKFAKSVKEGAIEGFSKGGLWSLRGTCAGKKLNDGGAAEVQESTLRQSGEDFEFCSDGRRRKKGSTMKEYASKKKLDQKRL